MEKERRRLSASPLAFDRREFIRTGLAGTVALAAGALPAAPAPAKVDVWVFHGEDKQKLMAACLEVISKNGGFGRTVRKLALKVNAAWARGPETGANTHPELVARFLEPVRKGCVSRVGSAGRPAFGPAVERDYLEGNHLRRRDGGGPPSAPTRRARALSGNLPPFSPGMLPQRVASPSKNDEISPKIVRARGHAPLFGWALSAGLPGIRHPGGGPSGKHVQSVRAKFQDERDPGSGPGVRRPIDRPETGAQALHHGIDPGRTPAAEGQSGARLYRGGRGRQHARGQASRQRQGFHRHEELAGAVEDRRYWHRNDLHQCIADFNTLVRPTWTIVDATRIMKDHGPQGPARRLEVPNLLILSRDPVAADAWTSRLFVRSPLEVGYIRIAGEMGIGVVDPAAMTVHRIEVPA